VVLGVKVALQQVQVLRYKAWNRATREAGVNEFAWMMILRRLLPVIVGVPFFASISRSWRVLLLGLLGLALGFMVPEPRVYAHYSSVEAAYLDALYGYVSHVATWSTYGAIGGTLCGCVLLLWRRRDADGEEQTLASDPSGG